MRARGVLFGALAISLAALIGGVFFAGDVLASKRLGDRSAACEESQSDERARIGCWLELAYESLREDGLDAGFKTFDYLYESYPLFGSTGCHAHAHKLGDAAYYDYFLAQGLALSDVQFPSAATACGYGFFHGFIEHYVQDTPTPEFATETCEFMRERWTPHMRDIAMICYHATGHGFTQASAEVLGTAAWGDMDRIVRKPLELCDTLPRANAEEIEECKEGVFNVINDWMTGGDRGLSLDLEAPFEGCKRQKQENQYACYYEFAQNVLQATGWSPVAAASYSSVVEDEEMRHVVFSVIIAGMTQATVSRDEHTKLFDECATIPDTKLHTFCIISLVNGMMEHGDPGDEYRRIIDACELPALLARDARKLCYETLAARLSRFYSTDKKLAICRDFPREFRVVCEESR